MLQPSKDLIIRNWKIMIKKTKWRIWGRVNTYNLQRHFGDKLSCTSYFGNHQGTRALSQPCKKRSEIYHHNFSRFRVKYETFPKLDALLSIKAGVQVPQIGFLLDLINQRQGGLVPTMGVPRKAHCIQNDLKMALSVRSTSS